MPRPAAVNREIKKQKMPQKKGIEIEVLVEGPGGELFFKLIVATRANIRELINTTKNPVVKMNLEKAAKERGIKI